MPNMGDTVPNMGLSNFFASRVIKLGNAATGHDSTLQTILRHLPHRLSQSPFAPGALYLMSPLLSHFHSHLLLTNPMSIVPSWAQHPRTPILPLHLLDLVSAPASMLCDHSHSCHLFLSTGSYIPNLPVVRPDLYQDAPPLLLVRYRLPTLPPPLLVAPAPLRTTQPVSVVRSPTPSSYSKSRYRCPRRRSSTPLHSRGPVLPHDVG